MNDELISKQAAIEAPKKLIKNCNPDHFVGHQKFIEFMNNAEVGNFGQWQFANGFNMGLTAAEVAIKALPPAQPEKCEDCGNFNKTQLLIPQSERKTGRWIYHPEIKNIYGGKCIECSECGEKYMVVYIEDEKYCRNCGSYNGAKMEREQKHLGNKSDLVILDEVKGE